ncbi:MAG: tail fiber protein [Candidatus Omnitrophica bacterium]|nr:tail fiber protein [Candidatus Omnitrophota bacterium]
MVTGEDLSPRILLESVPYSFYSDNAAEASHAVLADNATHASTATNATNATTSVNATNAVHAISADNSTTATTASMANTATTANNALNLGGQTPSFYGVPPGTIVAFGGDTPPAGWLLCDGSTVRASVYPALFAAIGNSWGHGENTPEDTDPDTFSLPDLRGFFLRGVGGDDARNPDRNSRANIRYGGNQGDQVGTWEWDTLQRHRHRIGLFSSPEMNSPHKTARGASINSEYSSAWSTNHPQTIDTGIEGNVVDPWGNQLGARFSTETRPKNAAVHFIIKP